MVGTEDGTELGCELGDSEATLVGLTLGLGDGIALLNALGWFEGVTDGG
jgi:hypothetical protein